MIDPELFYFLVVLVAVGAGGLGGVYWIVKGIRRMFRWLE